MNKFVLSAFADESAESLDGQIAALKRNKISMIEIRNIDGKCIIDYDDNWLFQIKEKLSKNQIKVSAIASPIGKYDIELPFEEELERFKKALNAAKILDTKRIRMFSFFTKNVVDKKLVTTEVNRRLKVFTDMANEVGIGCYHENEKEIYGDIKDRVLEIHKENKQLKGIFDPANYIQCGQNPIEILPEIEQYIDYIHVKDAFLADGSVVPAGMGDANMAEILKIFHERDGEILLTIEPHLTVFKGLDNLQNEVIRHKFSYDSQEEAFDTAVNSLKNILDGEGYLYE